MEKNLNNIQIGQISLSEPVQPNVLFSSKASVDLIVAPYWQTFD